MNPANLKQMMAQKLAQSGVRLGLPRARAQTNPSIADLEKLNGITWSNPMIDDNNFGNTSRSSNQYKNFNFDPIPAEDDIVNQMTKQGYRPANTNELLNYADSSQPDTQTYALGSAPTLPDEVLGTLARQSPFLTNAFGKKFMQVSPWTKQSFPQDSKIKRNYLGVRDN